MTTPNYLYHGSRFEQEELKPGYHHTGKLVQWDGTESNKFLYATTDEALAVELGFASSIEKQFAIDRFHVDNGVITIVSPEALTVAQLENVPVFVYTLEHRHTDGWIKNANRHNGIDTEYKTPNVITTIAKRTPMDVKRWLSRYRVNIERNTPPSAGGASKTVMEDRPAYASW